jgi:hypothetical protein
MGVKAQDRKEWSTVLREAETREEEVTDTHGSQLVKCKL